MSFYLLAIFQISFSPPVSIKGEVLHTEAPTLTHFSYISFLLSLICQIHNLMLTIYSQNTKLPLQRAPIYLRDKYTRQRQSLLCHLPLAHLRHCSWQRYRFLPHLFCLSYIPVTHTHTPSDLPSPHRISSLFPEGYWDVGVGGWRKSVKVAFVGGWGLAERHTSDMSRISLLREITLSERLRVCQPAEESRGRACEWQEKFALQKTCSTSWKLSYSGH